MGRVINYPYQLYVILINTNTELPVYQFSKTNRLDMAAGSAFLINGNIDLDTLKLKEMLPTMRLRR